MYGRRLRAGDKVDSPYRDLRRRNVYRRIGEASRRFSHLNVYFPFGFLFSMLIFTSLSSFSFSPVPYCDSIFSLLERDEMTVELRFLHGIDICYEQVIIDEKEHGAKSLIESIDSLSCFNRREVSIFFFFNYIFFLLIIYIIHIYIYMCVSSDFSTSIFFFLCLYYFFSATNNFIYFQRL